jgi:hypothetical protein
MHVFFAAPEHLNAIAALTSKAIVAKVKGKLESPLGTLDI